MCDQPSGWQGDLDRHDLDKARVPSDPFELFARWHEAAMHCGQREPRAMPLAAVDADGTPSARTVLLKGFAHAGYRFYTNYDSAKGRALAVHPEAALVFWWAPLERQVRIVGRVGKLSAKASDDYFAKRPRISQLGVHASAQSRP